jgi:hypothetical protein
MGKEIHLELLGHLIKFYGIPESVMKRHSDPYLGQNLRR